MNTDSVYLVVNPMESDVCALCSSENKAKEMFYQICADRSLEPMIDLYLLRVPLDQSIEYIFSTENIQKYNVEA